jgi:hypothetical protein
MIWSVFHALENSGVWGRAPVARRIQINKPESPFHAEPVQDESQSTTLDALELPLRYR